MTGVATIAMATRTLGGKDRLEIEELKQQGLSIKAISKLSGYDRKTIREYL